MPNEHDGLTEPENDLSDLARGVLSGRLVRPESPPAPSEEPDPPPTSDLVRALRDASPDELRRMIVSPGVFEGSGADLEAARHTWDDIVSELRTAVTTVEGEGAWQAFMAREAAAEHESAVAEAIKEGFLRSLEGEATAPSASGSSGASVLDFIDAEPEGTAPPGAVEHREAPSKFDIDEAVRSLWSFPRLAAAVAGGLAIVIVVYLLFAPGGDSNDLVGGGGSGGGDGASATAAATGASTATAETTVSAGGGGAGGGATAVPTLSAVDLPDLVICPDGSSFSGFEQPDGSYLDATSGEPRACPAPAN